MKNSSHEYHFNDRAIELESRHMVDAAIRIRVNT